MITGKTKEQELWDSYTVNDWLGVLRGAFDEGSTLISMKETYPKAEQALQMLAKEGVCVRRSSGCGTVWYEPAYDLKIFVE